MCVCDILVTIYKCLSLSVNDRFMFVTLIKLEYKWGGKFVSDTVMIALAMNRGIGLLGFI